MHGRPQVTMPIEWIHNHCFVRPFDYSTSPMRQKIAASRWLCLDGSISMNGRIHPVLRTRPAKETRPDPIAPRHKQGGGLDL
jgi:hypothetical protein